MAQKTPNYNLNKPGYEDFGDVDTLNENFEKIDKVLAATDPTKVTTKAEPADARQSGCCGLALRRRSASCSYR